MRRPLPMLTAIVAVSSALVAVPVAAGAAQPGAVVPSATEVVLVDLVDLGVPSDAAAVGGLLEVGIPGVDVAGSLDALDVVVASVTPEGRDALARSALVESVREPLDLRFTLDTSAVAVGATEANAVGFTGAGKVVAVVDSGIDADHPGLTVDGASSVVAEACFLAGTDLYVAQHPGMVIREACGNSTSELSGIGPGSAEPCTLLPSDCTHGTHVAGVVSGDDPTYRGVAPDAGLLSIRVGAVVDDGFTVANHIPELGVLAALEHVLEMTSTYDIAAVNLSLGGDPSICASPTPNWDDIVGRLVEAGVAVVAASGNGSSTGSITFPACLDQVVSVGASADDATVAPFSDSSEQLDLLAPGVDITSTVLAAVDPSGYGALDGTSFAAPHVAASFALLDVAHAGFDVDRTTELLRATGRMITRPTPAPDDHDPRFPELQIAEAAAFVPFPDATTGFWVAAADWARYTGVSTGIWGLFEPELPLTRAQAVTFLWRFMGAPAASLPAPFVDVDRAAWYAAAVDWAAEAGVTTGLTATTFGPDEPVSRAQLATFMWRTAGLPAASGPAGFVDVAAGAWYAAAVDWMAEHAITTGTTASTFSPDDVVTRAQMVTFEHRLAGSPSAWSGSVAPPPLALF